MKVSHQARMEKMTRLENVAICSGLLIFILVLITGYLLYAIEMWTNVLLFTIFLMIHAGLLFWGWIRMRLLLRFNSNEAYRRYVQIEGGGVLLTVVALSLFVWGGVMQVNQNIAYPWLGTLIILPFVYMSAWVDRRLKEIDSEHVTHQELRKQRRLMKVGKR